MHWVCLGAVKHAFLDDRLQALELGQEVLLEHGLVAAPASALTTWCIVAKVRVRLLGHRPPTTAAAAEIGRLFGGAETAAAVVNRLAHDVILARQEQLLLG